MSKIALGFLLVMWLTTNNISDSMIMLAGLMFILDLVIDTFKGK